MRTANRNRLASIWILLSVGQFVVMAAVAMANYPGGHPFDLASEGYDFWHNTLCDLGETVTESGLINPGTAKWFNASMVIVMLSFVPLWLILPRTFPSRRKIGMIVRVAGMLSLAGMLGVGLTPADRYVFLHSFAIGCAAIPGIPALLLAVTGMFADRQCPRVYAIGSAVFLVIVGIHFTQYVQHFWLGYPWTPAAPICQKIAVTVGLVWMIATAIITWRRKREADTT